MKTTKANAMYITWDELDSSINQWAREKLGTRGEGSRDGTDFELTFSVRSLKDDLDVTTFNAKMEALYDKYDTDKEYEVETLDVSNPDLNISVYGPVALGVINEILVQQNENFTCRSCYATYNGVIFFDEKINVG